MIKNLIKYLSKTITIFCEIIAIIVAVIWILKTPDFYEPLILIILGMSALITSLTIKLKPTQEEGDQIGDRQNVKPITEITKYTQSIIASKSVKGIREYNGVILVKGLEEDEELEKLPNGRYGYTVPWRKIDYTTEITTKHGTSELEIHKDINGKLSMIGYVTDSDLLKISSNRGKIIDLIVFIELYNKYPEANNALSIPVNQIINKRDKHKYGGDVTVIDMKLQVDE